MGIAPESDGRFRITQAEVVQHDFRQPNRQRGTDDQKMEWRYGLETKEGVHGERKGRGVPQLRCVGVRIGAWGWTIGARESADALGNAMFRVQIRKGKERLRRAGNGSATSWTCRSENYGDLSEEARTGCTAAPKTVRILEDFRSFPLETRMNRGEKRVQFKVFGNITVSTG